MGKTICFGIYYLPFILLAALLLICAWKTLWGKYCSSILALPILLRFRDLWLATTCTTPTPLHVQSHRGQSGSLPFSKHIYIWNSLERNEDTLGFSSRLVPSHPILPRHLQISKPHIKWYMLYSWAQNPEPAHYSLRSQNNIVSYSSDLKHRCSISGCCSSLHNYCRIWLYLFNLDI